MSQGFKLRFDEMRESNPTDNNDPSSEKMTDLYQTPGHARNLCLSWPDGRRFFLNYSYLIAGEFKPDSEKNLLRLNFSSHTVSLQGYSLEALFVALLEQLPRIIQVADSRYILEEDREQPIVVEITVEKI